MSEEKKQEKKTPKKAEAKIRDLARLLDETGLSEITLKEGGVEIKVARQTLVASSAPVAPAPAAGAAPTKEESKEETPAGAVPSPMVGTIYLSPEPGSDTFVKEGDKVKKGDTLFIIEAMKTMNNVAAPADGRVVKILVSNEQPVEFGEPLAIIE